LSFEFLILNEEKTIINLKFKINNFLCIPVVEIFRLP